ncbi:hypothetical protein ACFYOV_03545 [Streptomyces sp. NPDC005931]|uniref:hypothetical protein n=1 Tax=Streptomyces sp. NPDC005931 TaxID=3364737 RepID=UPI0036C7016A
MSTAPSPRPDETAGPPGPVNGADRAGGPDRNPKPTPWTRRLLVGLVLALLTWGVAALLSPEDGAVRQLAAAGLVAGAAVAVQHLHGPHRGAPAGAPPTQAPQTGAPAEVPAEAVPHADPRSVLTRYTQDVRQLAEHRRVVLERGTDAHPGPALPCVDAVPDLATNLAEILAPGPPILSTFVRLEMKRVIGYMTDLTTLNVECPGENHDWMITLTRAAEESICATSTGVDPELWNSEPAGRYLHAHREAIDEHGVPVRRLFLLKSARELDDRLLRLCEEQEVLHIEVRVAVLPELPPHLLRGATGDYILYDGAVSLEIEQDLRDVYVRTRLIARPDHVQDRMKRFEELWEAGMSIRELEVRADDQEKGTWMVDRA